MCKFGNLNNITIAVINMDDNIVDAETSFE